MSRNVCLLRTARLTVRLRVFFFPRKRRHTRFRNGTGVQTCALPIVVKAERERARAEGRTVVVAHGGDTLSPSVMSGLDQGAHIVALTNLIAPDLFVPGNHEFDFGKAVFLQRMSEATFPLYGANLRDPAGAPLPGFKDRSMITAGAVRIGLSGLAYEQSPRM